MIPHPTTWQNARERDRQDLLLAAARFNRETRLLGASASRRLGTPSRLAARMLDSATLTRWRPQAQGPRAPLDARAPWRFRLRRPRLLFR